MVDRDKLKAIPVKGHHRQRTIKEKQSKLLLLLNQIALYLLTVFVQNQNVQIVGDLTDKVVLIFMPERTFGVLNHQKADQVAVFNKCRTDQRGGLVSLNILLGQEAVVWLWTIKVRQRKYPNLFELADKCCVAIK